MHRSLLVTDFDGTLTRQDFFRLATEAFAPAGLADYWSRYVAGQITHFEALQGIFANIRASEAEVLAVLTRAEPDPALASWIAALDAAGWEVVVASAGCTWYIHRILAASGVNLEVHANPGRFDPERGLVMELPVDSPYFCRSTGIDKAAIVQAALAQGRTTAFAGDGFPDATAARLVRPELRFARADLATALERDGMAYQPFERWGEVAECLLSRQ